MSISHFLGRRVLLLSSSFLFSFWFHCKCCSILVTLVHSTTDMLFQTSRIQPSARCRRGFTILSVAGPFHGLRRAWSFYRGADKSLDQPGRKQAQKYVRDARDFNNIETRAVINFFFLQGKALKEIHAILTEILAYFLPGRAKDLSAPL